MKMGVQAYSSWYVPQRYSEDNHGPHHTMLPQLGVSRQRPHRSGQYWHACTQGQALHLHAVSQAVHAYLVEQPRDLVQGHADEIRVKTPGGIVWLALAMRVRTRLG